MATDHDTAMALQRHLGECDMRHREVSRRLDESAEQRTRMEAKIDDMLANMHRAKGGLAVLMVVGGGVAGLISWATAKITMAPGALK